MEKDKYFGLSPRIACWKIDTPLENWLSLKADESDFWKRFYIFYYMVFDPKYYRNGVKIAEKCIEVYKDNFTLLDRGCIIRDMVYCLHRFGISFEDYCIYNFVDKSNHCRNSFVSDKLRHYYCDILNSKSIITLLNDKYKCYKKYKEFFKREVLGCYVNRDKGDFIEFISKHEQFIFKPIDGNCGHGVKIISLEEDDASSFFDKSIVDGPFVVEELINQGKEMAALHPQSINSLRVSTFVLKGNVHINAIALRMVLGDSVVDNAGTGGIYASVDPEFGFVQTDARDYKGRHFNIHPDTGVQIIGRKLPEWDEALSLIHKIAICQEGSVLIAWDIAYSDKGWLMVEGNAVGSWDLLQSNKQIGKKAELFSYMDEYFKVREQLKERNSE